MILAEANNNNTDGNENVIEDEEGGKEEDEDMDEDMELIEEFHDCNCRFYPNLFSDFAGAFYGGCVIDEFEPPPVGYQCHCSMPFFFTCKGDPVEYAFDDGPNKCSGGYGEECCDPSGNCGGYFQKREDEHKETSS